MNEQFTLTVPAAVLANGYLIDSLVQGVAQFNGYSRWSGRWYPVGTSRWRGEIVRARAKEGGANDATGVVQPTPPPGEDDKGDC